MSNSDPRDIFKERSNHIVFNILLSKIQRLERRVKILEAKHINTQQSNNIMTNSRRLDSLELIINDIKDNKNIGNGNGNNNNNNNSNNNNNNNVFDNYAALLDNLGDLDEIMNYEIKDEDLNNIKLNENGNENGKIENN